MKDKEREILNIQLGMFLKASSKWFYEGKGIFKYGKVYEGKF